MTLITQLFILILYYGTSTLIYYIIFIVYLPVASFGATGVLYSVLLIPRIKTSANCLVRVTRRLWVVVDSTADKISLVSYSIT